MICRLVHSPPAALRLPLAGPLPTHAPLGLHSQCPIHRSTCCPACPCATRRCCLLYARPIDLREIFHRTSSLLASLIQSPRVAVIAYRLDVFRSNHNRAHHDIHRNIKSSSKSTDALPHQILLMISLVKINLRHIIDHLRTKQSHEHDTEIC